MNYPTIDQYTETIKLAAQSTEDYFDKLRSLQPVLDSNGEPIMSSGNFAVVFKMYNHKNYKYYALKCFHREQEGRRQNYQKISEELNRELSQLDFGTQDLFSTYLVHVQYYEKEIYVNIGEPISLFPVLLMEWIDGITIDKFIMQNVNNTKLLHTITYKFSRMAKWLLTQRFAHGDLKPDNILITKEKQLVLLDYDGMYVPSMKGQKANELGSPNFRHPLRNVDEFNEHIDDFPIVNILLSLKAISLNPFLFIQHVTGDKLLFEEKDYLTLNNCKIIPLLNEYLNDGELATLLGAFYILLYSNFLPNSLSSIIDIQESDELLINNFPEIESKDKILYFYNNIEINPFKLVYLISDLFGNKLRKYWLPGNLWDKCHVDAIWWDEDTYKSIHNWVKDFDTISYCVVGEFSKKSRPNVLNLSYIIHSKDYSYIVDYTYEILSEMNVLNYFLENVMKLIEIINIDNLYDFKREDLPF